MLKFIVLGALLAQCICATSDDTFLADDVIPETGFADIAHCGGAYTACGQCEKNNQNKCIDCDHGYYLAKEWSGASEKKCHKYECSHDYKHLTTDASKMTTKTKANNVCVNNKCTCSNGQGYNGAGCQTDGMHKCRSCNGGYWLHVSNGVARCKPNICKCSNGAAATGTACKHHDKTRCTQCNTGHALKDGACTTCKSGYHMDKGKCGKCVCKHGASTDWSGGNCKSGLEEELAETGRRLLGSGGGGGGHEGGFKSDCTKHKNEFACKVQPNLAGKAFCKWNKWN